MACDTANRLISAAVILEDNGYAYIPQHLRYTAAYVGRLREQVRIARTELRKMGKTGSSLEPWVHSTLKEINEAGRKK